MYFYIITTMTRRRFGYVRQTRYSKTYFLCSFAYFIILRGYQWLCKRYIDYPVHDCSLEKLKKKLFFKKSILFIHLTERNGNILIIKNDINAHRWKNNDIV